MTSSPVNHFYDVIKLQEITSGFLEAVNHFNNLPNLVQTGFSNLLKLFALSKLIKFITFSKLIKFITFSKLIKFITLSKFNVFEILKISKT